MTWTHWSRQPIPDPNRPNPYKFRIVTRSEEVWFSASQPVDYLYDAEASQYQLVVLPRILFLVWTPGRGQESSLFNTQEETPDHEPPWELLHGKWQKKKKSLWTSSMIYGANILYPELVKKSLYIIGEKSNKLFPEPARIGTRCKVAFASEQEPEVYERHVTYLEKAEIRWDRGIDEFVIREHRNI